MFVHGRQQRPLGRRPRQRGRNRHDVYALRRASCAGSSSGSTFRRAGERVDPDADRAARAAGAGRIRSDVLRQVLAAHRRGAALVPPLAAITYYGLNASDGPGRKDKYIAESIRQQTPTSTSANTTSSTCSAAGASADRRPDGAPGRPAARDGGQEGDPPRGLRRERPSDWRAHGYDEIVHETGHVWAYLTCTRPDLGGRLGSDELRRQPGAEFMAWQRWKFGWLDPSQMRCVQPGRTVEATLSPLETRAA